MDVDRILDGIAAAIVIAEGPQPIRENETKILRTLLRETFRAVKKGR